MEQALGDKAECVQRRFEDVYHHDYPLREMLSELGYELLDHVAARSVNDPDLQDERTRLVLTTAAESLFGRVHGGGPPAPDGCRQASGACGRVRRAAVRRWVQMVQVREHRTSRYPSGSATVTPYLSQ